MSGNPNCSNRNPGILMCACERGAGRNPNSKHCQSSLFKLRAPLFKDQTVLPGVLCPRVRLISQFFPVDYVRTG